MSEIVHETEKCDEILVFRDSVFFETLRFRHGKADAGIIRVYFPDSSNEAKFTNYKSLIANSSSKTSDILQQSLQKYSAALPKKTRIRYVFIRRAHEKPEFEFIVL